MTSLRIEVLPTTPEIVLEIMLKNREAAPAPACFSGAAAYTVGPTFD